MSNAEWKEKAKALFFIEKYNIDNISFKLGISKRSISKYLNSLPEYNGEVSRRKAENAAKRKEYEQSESRRKYKREWDRYNRNNNYHKICADAIKQDHITAVKILSRERFF